MVARVFGAVALGWLISQTAAQDVLKTFDVFSAEDCGADPTEKTIQLTVFANQQGDKTNFATSCSSVNTVLPGWPTSNSAYTAWIDSSIIDDKCQLVFFRPPPADDDLNTGTCFQAYRAIHKNSNCARVTLYPKFGYR
jgi:hypothetical protein